MRKNSNATFSTKQKGKLAEVVALFYLRFCGYKIIEKNFTTKFGELDIIAKKKDTIVIIEVKARYKQSEWHPLSAINQQKKMKIKNLVKYYIISRQLFGLNLRIDAVILKRCFFWFSIKHYKNLFSLI